MPFAFINSASRGPGGTGGATLPIDTTGATLIIIAAARFNAGSVSDSEGNVWTLIDTTGLDNVTVDWYYCIDPTTSATHTFSYTGGGLTFPGIAVAAYSGTSVSFDQETTSSSANALSDTAAPITPSRDSSLCVVVQGHEDPNAHSVNEGFVGREDLVYAPGTSIGIYLADKILLAASEQSPTITGGAISDRLTQFATFTEPDLADFILPVGIPSAEAFGTASVALTVETITPEGIVSAEAFGSPIVSVDLETIEATGIASAEAFGTTTVSRLKFLSPEGIPSSEAFGDTIVGNKVIRQDDGIPSEEAFGTVVIYDSKTKPFYGSIAEADQFFSARLKRFYWETATEQDKNKALYHARMLIDRFDYLDQKFVVREWLDDNPDADLEENAATLREIENSQVREFPRGQSAVVPEEIKKASYLIAQELLSGRDPEADLENLNVQSASYGGLRTTYQRQGNNQEHLAHLIPSPQAFNLIRPFFRERDLFDTKRVS